MPVAYQLLPSDLELKLIANTYHVDVGLVVIIVIPNMLIAVESANRMLLGQFPVKAYVITYLLKAPGIEQFCIDIRRHRKTFLIVF
jgi:hypothetical protein